MQTLLGAGGAIGSGLATELKHYSNKIRLVSRNPEKINETDELVAADLLNRDAVSKAISGSSVVYVIIGFPYRLKIWQACWPKFMKDVIDACIEHDSKLVFFDNIYMYDPECLNGMTEDTPIKPSSKKGIIRAEIANMVLKKVEEGKLKALIARSADFYGPGIKQNSILTETVFKPLVKGKMANWMGSVNFKHSFTYTPDAARATALLGNTKSAYNQVWHLPTAPEPMTGKEWIEGIAHEFGVQPRYLTATRLLMKMMGLFDPILREMPEMMYQYDRDYIFNSNKFDRNFDFQTTTYSNGIREIIKSDYLS